MAPLLQSASHAAHRHIIVLTSVYQQRHAMCSAKYALRPYLYLVLHAAIAAPAAVFFGPGTGETLGAKTIHAYK